MIVFFMQVYLTMMWYRTNLLGGIIALPYFSLSPVFAHCPEYTQILFGVQIAKNRQ